MENKQTDVHLRAMLNSPARFQPTVPVPTPDWNSIPTQQSFATQNAKNISNMIVATPGSVVGEPHTNIVLQNCVVIVDLHTTLDLAVVNARTRNSEYNPSRFHGVVMRIREPRSTALIFRSGKLVVTGTRNESDALLASKKFARIIQKIGFNVKFANFKLQNLVATCDLRFPIKLENLNHVHGQFSSYEPELFPGLVYRMIKPRIALLIFVNGKIVFTDRKSVV